MAIKFITLSQIIGVTDPQGDRDSEFATGEDDDAADGPTEPRLVTQPNRIAVDSIRNFYPRKDGEPGTRVILKSGVAYIVAETFDEVVESIEGRVATPAALIEKTSQ